MRGAGNKASGHMEQYAQAIKANGSDFLWQLYRNFLEGPMQIVLPEHTRDALFQLFCELRTNTKKDQKWAYQHGRALKPQTFPGWIALGSFISASLAFSSLASSALIVTGLGLVSAIVGLALIIGLIAGFWMLVVSGCLFGGTFLFAWLATISAIGYAILSVIRSTVYYVRRIVQRISEPQGTSHTYRQHRQNLGLKSDESIQMQSFLPDPRSSSSVVPVPSTIIPKDELEVYNKNEGKTSSGPSNGSQQSRYTGIDSNDLKKGKRSFAELQQEFGSSGQNKVSQDPEIKSGESASNENKSDTSTQNKPPDLSPGRIEDGLWQNDAKGPQAAANLKPEGGPSVEGKFAEAVHPQATPGQGLNGQIYGHAENK